MLPKQQQQAALLLVRFELVNVPTLTGNYKAYIYTYEYVSTNALATHVSWLCSLQHLSLNAPEVSA